MAKKAKRHPKANLYSATYYSKNREKVLARIAAKPTREVLWLNAKYRAIAKGVPFAITPEDIEVPEVCPVLGIPLVRNHSGKGHKYNSPTLDRVIPELGYVKGNIVVMSARANTIKSNANASEILKVGFWLASRMYPDGKKI